MMNMYPWKELLSLQKIGVANWLSQERMAISIVLRNWGIGRRGMKR